MTNRIYYFTGTGNSMRAARVIAGRLGDDGLFMTPEPLTDDFYAAILCWDLSIADLKAICRRSISGSGLSNAENELLMKAWEAKWNQFIDEISTN